MLLCNDLINRQIPGDGILAIDTRPVPDAVAFQELPFGGREILVLVPATSDVVHRDGPSGPLDLFSGGVLVQVARDYETVEELGPDCISTDKINQTYPDAPERTQPRRAGCHRSSSPSVLLDQAPTTGTRITPAGFHRSGNMSRGISSHPTSRAIGWADRKSPMRGTTRSASSSRM